MDKFPTVRAVTESGFVSVHAKGMEGACDFILPITVLASLIIVFWHLSNRHGELT